MRTAMTEQRPGEGQKPWHAVSRLPAQVARYRRYFPWLPETSRAGRQAPRSVLEQILISEQAVVSVQPPRVAIRTWAAPMRLPDLMMCGADHAAILGSRSAGRKVPVNIEAFI